MYFLGYGGNDGGNAMGYTCPYCYKSLSRPDSLKRHLNEVHCDKPVEMWDKCPLCSKRYKSYDQLAGHLTQVHSIPRKDFKQLGITTSRQRQ